VRPDPSPEDLLIREYSDPDDDPTIPHTIVRKRGLVVHTIHDGYRSSRTADAGA
jgi:hypothetical protein